MMTKRSAWLSLLLLLACVSMARAQGNRKDSGAQAAKPDLSGTWVLNKAKSGDGAGSYDFDDLTLVIVHRDPELRITKKTARAGKESVQELVYYTDGRGETNRLTGGGDAVTSKTSWRKDRLHVVNEQQLRAGANFAYFDITDKWELSKDGKVLTQTTRVELSRTRPSPGIFVPASTGDFKRVFVRAP